MNFCQEKVKFTKDEKSGIYIFDFDSQSLRKSPTFLITSLKSFPHCNKGCTSIHRGKPRTITGKQKKTFDMI
ncbi:MAG UNVERIFIED_CONTAM: hypothetical protein LVR29_00920 [Microcystis novacekii LVE1205-3]